MDIHFPRSFLIEFSLEGLICILVFLFRFQPSHEAVSNLECRFVSFLSQEHSITIASRYSIRSAIHSNKTHILTLSQQGQGSQLTSWSAQWLLKAEIQPPISMQIELRSVSADEARKIVSNTKSIFAKSRYAFCKNVWEKFENAKERRDTQSWIGEFKLAHQQCQNDKDCMWQVRSKCIEKGQQILGSLPLLTYCNFPVSSTSNLSFFTSRKTRKRRLCQTKKCLKRKRKMCKNRLKLNKLLNQSQIQEHCRKSFKLQRCMMRKSQKRKHWTRKQLKNFCKRRRMRNN